MAENDGLAGDAPKTTGRPGLVRTVARGGSGPFFYDGLRPGASARLAGVVLDLARDVDDLRIVIVDRDGEPAYSFGPFAEEDVIAVWRSLAGATGLTPMMRAWNGRTEPLACQLGRLRLGQAQDRRRLGVLSRRRPRFLVRRKSARLPPRPLIFREREIAGGRGG